MDVVEQLAAWTEGTLEEDEVIALFQELVDTGHAWELDGHTARTATELMEAGLVTPTDEAREAFLEVRRRRGW